jgi:hypothetical protein
MADSDEPKCTSCGKPFVRHDGIIRTCKALLEMTADRDRWKAKAIKKASKKPTKTKGA